MINVFPREGLVKRYVFRDNSGNRLGINPAETLDDVDKTPQEFDETDPLVAAKLLSLAETKELKIEKADRDKLKDTVKQAKADAKRAQEAEDAKQAVIEGKAGASEAEVEKVKEKFKNHVSPAKHKSEVEKAATAAAKEAKAQYKGFVSPEDQQKAIDEAVAAALADQKPETGEGKE